MKESTTSGTERKRQDRGSGGDRPRGDARGCPRIEDLGSGRPGGHPECDDDLRTYAIGGASAGPPLALRPGWLLEVMRKGAMQAVEELLRVECEAALGATRYERTGQRLGYRNGITDRALGTPQGQVHLEVPRARLRNTDGKEREWRSHVLPRYQRRMEEVNAAVAEVYLAGVNSRRVKAALRPLLRDVALSKSAVSRIVGRLRSAYETWRVRPLEPGAYAYLFLDGIFVRRRVDRKVEKLPVLIAVGVRWDGRKELL